MRVFLVHGMGRSPLAMAWLSRRLRAAGHACDSFGYSVRRESLDRIGARFVRRVREVVQRDGGGPYAVVGHSLGGIITRMVSGELPDGFSRLVMLAPPNSSPALARAYGKLPVFRLLTRQAGRALGDRDFYAGLPVPRVPTLVMAGEVNPPWLPYRGGPADGIVSVEETRLPGARHRVVGASHTFIMNHPEVARAIEEFLAE